MIDRETALAHHLRYNTFPPARPDVLRYCLEALDAIEAGEPDRLIVGEGGSLSASDLADSLNLWPFVRERPRLRIVGDDE